MFFIKEARNALNNAVGAKEISNSKSSNNSPSFFDKYNAPEGAKPIVLSKSIIEKELEGFIDSIHIPILLSLFGKFNDTVSNCDYEWILGETDKGFSPESARTDNDKTYVYLHEELQNLKSSETLLVVIHNHVWGLNLLLSDKDLNLYLTNNVKYGVTTNENGILIIKNNNAEKLSEEDITNLLDGLEDVDELIVERFYEDEHIVFDKNNEDHKYLLNEYVKDNFDEWLDEYEKLFSDSDIEVKFIKVKNKDIN